MNLSDLRLTLERLAMLSATFRSGSKVVGNLVVDARTFAGLVWLAQRAESFTPAVLLAYVQAQPNYRDGPRVVPVADLPSYARRIGYAEAWTSALVKVWPGDVVRVDFGEVSLEVRCEP